MPARFTTMPHHDFLSCLEEAGLTCADFAAIADEPVERISRMMFGLERVAYGLSLLATLLTVRDARELALMHADVCAAEGTYAEPCWSQS